MSDNQLARELEPGIGHNQPPLGERLAEEVAPLKARLEELAGVAATAIIIDDESAAKIVDLVGLCRAHRGEVEAQRNAARAPYTETLKTIDQAYKPIADALTEIIGVDARSGLRGTLTLYERKRAAEAQAERDRITAEQNRRQAEAEAARRAAEEKKATGSGSVAEELAAMQAEDAAERLGRQAAGIRPEPVRAALGQVSTQRQIVCEITDLRKACGWLIKSPLVPTLKQVVKEIFTRHLRNLGVDTVARGVDIPGVEAKIENVARVR